MATKKKITEDGDIINLPLNKNSKFLLLVINGDNFDIIRNNINYFEESGLLTHMLHNLQFSGIIDNAVNAVLERQAQQIEEMIALSHMNTEGLVSN